MNKSNNKRFAFLFLGVFAFLLALCIAFVVIVDPFFVYRTKPDTSNFTWDQDYAPTWKVGMSRHQKGYDAIWVGSSLSTYVDTNYIYNELGYKCTTGIIASGRPNIYKLFIEEAIKDNDIKEVYFETVVSHWMWEYIGTEYDMSYIPNYVLTDFVLDDGAYWFNKDVFGQALIIGQREINSYLQQKKAGKEAKEIAASEESPIVKETEQVEGNAEKQNQIIPHDAVFSIKSMAPRISSNTTLNISDDTLLYFETIGKANIEKNIIPMIKNNPNIEFVFVMPPTGIMGTSSMANADLLETYLAVEEHMLSMLLEYDNVRIICALLDEEFNTDLENYMDDGHFCPQGAYNEIDFIRDGKYEITKDNIHEMLLGFIEMADNFKWPFLKEGFLGADVEKLQDALAGMGYPIDDYGVFGPLTREAVSDFQAKNGFDVSGIAYEETLNAIYKE